MIKKGGAAKENAPGEAGERKRPGPKRGYPEQTANRIEFGHCKSHFLEEQVNRTLSVLIFSFLISLLSCGCMESKQEAKKYFSEGVEFEKQGDFEKASDRYAFAIKSWSSYTEAHREYQDMEIRLGRYPELVERYKKLRDGHPKSPCYLYLFGRLEKDSSERIAYYKKALDNDPNYLWAIDGIGNEYLKQGKNQEAVKQLKKVIEIDSEFPQVHLSLARAWHSMGLQDPALSEIKKYCDLTPESDAGFELMGNIYMAKGEPEKAEESWKRASALSPGSTSPLTKLAGLYLSEDRRDECERVLGEIYAVNPAHPEAKLTEAWLRFKTGDAAKAAKILSMILMKDPSNREALRLKALIFKGRGDRDKELACLLRILELDPMDSGALEETASIEMDRGKPGEAAKILLPISGKSGLSTKSKRILADHFFFKGDFDESGKFSEQTIAGRDASLRDYERMLAIRASEGDCGRMKRLLGDPRLKSPSPRLLAVKILIATPSEKGRDLGDMFRDCASKSKSGADKAFLEHLAKAAVKPSLESIRADKKADTPEDALERAYLASKGADGAKAAKIVREAGKTCRGTDAEACLKAIEAGLRDKKDTPVSRIGRLAKICSGTSDYFAFAYARSEINRESKSAGSPKGTEKQ